MAATFTALVIRGEGDSETMQAACRTIGQMLAGFNGNGQAAATVEPAAPAIEAAPPTSRITRRPRRPKVERYEKPADEPDGFGGAPPSAATPTFVKNAEQNAASRGSQAGSGMSGRIIRILDDGGGVATIQTIQRKLGGEVSERGIMLASSKCPQLKRVGDDRVALVNWEESDD